MITLLTLVVMAAPQATVEVQMTHGVRLVQQVEVSVNLPPNLADQVCINQGIPPLRDNLTVYSKLGAEALMAHYPVVARRFMSQDSSRVIGCIVEAEVILYKKKASKKKSRKQRKKRSKRHNRKK